MHNLTKGLFEFHYDCALRCVHFTGAMKRFEAYIAIGRYTQRNATVMEIRLRHCADSRQRQTGIADRLQE